MARAANADFSPPGACRRLARRLRGGGLRWLAAALVDRIAPARLAFREEVRAGMAGRRLLEIGGPSRVFGRRGMLPVYRDAARIDNVNFAAATAWEDSLQDGGPFHFDAAREPGTQWLREASALTHIAHESYDAVLSSHCLEHVANPLAALREWGRVTRPGGHLLLVLPDPVQTFDHRRPITTLQHLREDFARGTPEDDRSHLAEVLALHDRTRDAGAGSAEEFRRRCEHNATQRCLHHHVFDLELIAAALRESNWDPVAAAPARPMHLVAWARKGAR